MSWFAFFVPANPHVCKSDADPVAALAAACDQGEASTNSA